MTHTIHLTRVYADAEGASHFGELELPLTDAGAIGRLSERHPAHGVVFRQNPPEYDFDWHCAPRRQYIVLLDGEIELTVSDGERRRLAAGEILLVEDTWGQGHHTRNTLAQTRHSLFIPIDPEGADDG